MPKSHYHTFSILKRLIVAYVIVCLFMWAFQRNLLYFPQHSVKAPVDYGLEDFEDVKLKSSDGTAIQAWQHAAQAGYPTIVYFHGNGGNLGNRAHYYRLLSDAGFGILALSYRGYGSSEGSPSEQGFYQDARAIMEYASGTLAIPPEDLVLYGESIGTGVAVQMAAEFSIAALVLQSPYTSIDALAGDSYPWLPARYLVKDHFDSLSKISNVRAPLLLFHGEQDAVVPIQYGKALYEKAGEPKTAVYFPNYGHTDFDLVLLTQSLVAFIAEHHMIDSHHLKLLESPTP